LAREEGSTYKVEEHALADTRRALRLVRSRAAEWGLDPERVGVMGFSAGGQLASYAATRSDSGNPAAEDAVDRLSSRPSFQVLMSPGSIRADGVMPKAPPPAFICAAFDDSGPARTAIEVFERLRDAGGRAELHVYASGGHGFGMRDRPLPITGWPARLH